MSQPKGDNCRPAKGAGATIYVVDDEPLLLELARAILAPRGYNVRTFRDAESALEAFATARPRPALIMTDYAMHSMTGLSLIEECRRLEPRQKALLVSGTVNEQAYRAASCQPDLFLAKPYQAGQLAEAIKSLLADEAEGCPG